MKKVIVVMMLVLLIACGAKQQASSNADSSYTAPQKQAESQPVAAPTPAVSEQAKVEPQPTASTPAKAEVSPPARLPSERTIPNEPVVAEVKEEVNPQLRDLLKKTNEKLVSMRYLYGGTDTRNLFLDTYFVKGSLMKVKKYPENYYVIQGHYDTLYVDKGVACCEDAARCKSKNVDNTNKVFSIDKSTLRIPKTPLEWEKEIKPNAQIIGPQTFNSRTVTNIKYRADDGNDVLMWVDDTYGVPHKVVVTDKNGNEVKYQFNDLVFNQLKDADFIPSCN